MTRTVDHDGHEIGDDGASLGRAVRVWADEAVPALPDDFAEMVTRAAMGSPRAMATVDPPAISPANVVPIGAARKRSRAVWVAVPMMAAAAAGVFAVLSNSGPTGPTAIDAPVARTGSEVAASESHGSEVVAVEGDAPAGYTVMQLDGTREGSTVALVWFNDEEPAKGTVQ